MNNHLEKESQNSEKESQTDSSTALIQIKERFDGYLPIVIDLETGGLDPRKHPILEIAAVIVGIDEQNKFYQKKTDFWHVLPFENAKLDPESLKVTKIDPYHPFRFAIPEEKALAELFQMIEAELKITGCRRAILVGHNAHFDLSFLQAAFYRLHLKKNPFHAFTCFDTATLSGLLFGKTVLAKALKAAGLAYDKNKAHSAIYDAERTAELFCFIINSLK